MLVGFKSKNNWEQVKVRGAIDAVDERITPDDLYASYQARYPFTLDVAANGRNKKTERFYDLATNGLRQPWAPEIVWCNPPYSNLAAWLYKAHQEFEAGCKVIVMLLPANRTEQGWWQRFVEPFRDRPSGFLRTEFIPRRRNFGVPGNEGAVWKKGVPFGLVAVIFERLARPERYGPMAKACAEAAEEIDRLRLLLRRHQVAAWCEEDSDLAVETRAALDTDGQQPRDP